ncbi:MAG: hypothetical protein EU540_05590 [Promethearchaeota archaeon]|nr:MAG: hypothetical protein EU540_05590 [Candidatus Lokiarchaeota archaeon]
MERLYQPDFSSIFDKKYANAFTYGQVDTLVWAVFKDAEKSEILQNLLQLKNSEGREYFYNRKINIDDEKLELYSSNVQLALIQGMDLGREYGIANSDVITVVKKDPKKFIGVLSYNLSNISSYYDLLSDIEKIVKEIKIAGIVLYPTYTNLDLTNNRILNELLPYCKEKNYFIKIDVGNLFIPENNPEFTSYEKIKSFLSKSPENIIVLSGLDISGDFSLYYQLVKYFNNLWLELDPRSIGGMTPTDFFEQLFAIKGFIQNCWHRILIGSATPTLEISQMVRGFLEATENLPFSQKCILRTWAFRNVNRINSSVFPKLEEGALDQYETVLDYEQPYVHESENEVNLVYNIKLRSFSITQLIYLTQLIKEVLSDSLNKFPNSQNGEFFIRTYHTTTSLIVNEHEFGNYLDMHYMFAEITRKDSSKSLHTVRALENRADFNPFDHEIATTYGHKQLTLPIIKRNLEIGSRENFYVLVTFGPRVFQLYIKIKLLK